MNDLNGTFTQGAFTDHTFQRFQQITQGFNTACPVIEGRQSGIDLRQQNIANGNGSALNIVGK